MIRAVLLAGFLIVSGAGPEGQAPARPIEHRGRDQRQMFLILDSEDLSCPVCGRGLARFLERLKAHPVEHIIGIVTYPSNLVDPDSFLRILRRQIEGFRLGHRIDFPLVLIDRTHLLYSTIGGGTLVVLDLDHQWAERYTLPMTLEEMETLFDAGR